MLRQEIDSTTASEVRLHHDVIIVVRSGSFRTVRGRTLLASIVDEVAFLRDEASAYPDTELYRALLPALATTGGMLVGISTPYRKVGLLYQKHRDCFGVDDPNVLVVAGPSQAFNPTLDPRVIARAIASDPEGARAEWEAEFRADIAAFLDDESINAAVDPARPLELPPRPGIEYRAFCDASGGRHDAYTIAIGHLEGEHCICDALRGVKPPFDPKQVTAEFAALLRDYRINTVTGDNYAAAWTANAWAENRIEYQRAEVNKSQLYIEMLPGFMRGTISLPDHPPLLRELRLLERRGGRSGKDVVDHGRNGSDDFANSVAGLMFVLTAVNSEYDESLSWVSDSSQSPANPTPSGKPPVCGTSCSPEEAEDSDDINSKRGASDMTSKTKDDDNDDKNKVLKDGEVLTVRVHLMDSTQRTLAGGPQHSTLPATGLASCCSAMRSASAAPRSIAITTRSSAPGGRTRQLRQHDRCKCSTGDARMDPYARYQDRVANAWRHP